MSGCSEILDFGKRERNETKEFLESSIVYCVMYFLLGAVFMKIFSKTFLVTEHSHVVVKPAGFRVYCVGSSLSSSTHCVTLSSFSVSWFVHL